MMELKLLEGIVRDVALDEAWDYDKQECAYFICQAKRDEEHDSLCPHRRAKEYWEEHHGSKDATEAEGAREG